MTPGSATIAVIDPAGRVAETDCFNFIARRSSLVATYHVPALFGFDSLSIYNDEDPAGIIILGSSASVTDDFPWQRPLEAWLKPRLEHGVPAFGLCYGHQMLAHMFGGRVEFRDSAHSKLKGFRDVAVHAVEGLWPASKGPLVVSHAEHVTKLPDDFVVIAESPDCAVDGMRHKSLPIFGLQPHPEATRGFMHNQDIAYDESSDFTFGHRLVGSFLDFAARLKA